MFGEIDTQLTYSHTWGFKYYRNNAGLCTDPKKLPSMKEKGFFERDKNFQIEGLC